MSLYTKNKTKKNALGISRIFQGFSVLLIFIKGKFQIDFHFPKWPQKSKDIMGFK